MKSIDSHILGIIHGWGENEKTHNMTGYLGCLQQGQIVMQPQTISKPNNGCCHVFHFGIKIDNQLSIVFVLQNIETKGNIFRVCYICQCFYVILTHCIIVIFTGCALNLVWPQNYPCAIQTMNISSKIIAYIRYYLLKWNLGNISKLVRISSNNI